jgi:exopolyphosphatase/guanosine-5'-triphosphate,3'-diphosphate pyrophosphatase
MVCDVVWDEKWIKVNTSDYEEVTLIGSGVILINYLKCQVQGKKPLSYIYMTIFVLKFIDLRTKNCRVGTQSDRADVIIPATRIYLNAMKWVEQDKFMFLKLDYLMES